MKSLIALAICATAVASVHAEQVRVVRYGDDRLTGVTSVDIVVRVSPAGGTCTLTPSAIQDAAVAALRKSGVKASASARASSWFYTVYVRLASVAAADRCVTAVETELVAQVQGIPEADRDAPAGAWGSLLVGELSLLRESTILVSLPAAHPAQVEAMVVEQLAAVGERMRRANP